MSIPPDGLIVASGEGLRTGWVVASCAFSGSAGAGLGRMVNSVFGLGESFQPGSEVEDLTL